MLAAAQLLEIPVSLPDPGIASPSSPSPWIRRHAHLIAPAAPVLDLACGGGRHARFLARLGHPVLAVDRDPLALAALAGEPGVTVMQRDLETGTWPLGPDRYGAVIVARYLHRPIMAALVAAVADDGVLLYETFAQGNEAFGKPSNPDFLLRENELLDRVSPGLRVVAFEQGLEAGGERGRVVQRIAAVGRSRAWPPLLAGGPAP